MVFIVNMYNEDHPPVESAIASRTAPPSVLESRSDRTRFASWSKLANWTSILAVFSTLTYAYGDFHLHSYTLAIEIILAVILYPGIWAFLYGNFSILHWLYRCITLNRTRKQLWNRRATWSVAIAIFLTGAYGFTAVGHPSDGGTVSTMKDVATVLSLYYETCFFYGMVTGLTYLWQSRKEVRRNETLPLG